MITHLVTLPDGTKIEFFASDAKTFSNVFGDVAPNAKAQKRQKKQQRKNKQQARRQNRGK